MEWLNYEFGSQTSNERKLLIRASASGGPIVLQLRINNKKKEITVAGTALNEIDLGTIKIRKGGNTIRVLVKSGVLKLDWIKIE